MSGCTLRRLVGANLLLCSLCDYRQFVPRAQKQAKLLLTKTTGTFSSQNLSHMHLPQCCAVLVVYPTHHLLLHQCYCYSGVKMAINILSTTLSKRKRKYLILKRKLGVFQHTKADEASSDLE